jgi:hypothetical protein
LVFDDDVMVDHDVTGIPFDRDALVALESYAKNGHDYLQFSIGKPLN